jgi:hypothetical protein
MTVAGNRSSDGNARDEPPDEEQAAGIARQVSSSTRRLLDHLRTVEDDPSLDERAVHERYAGIIESRDIPGATDLIVALHEIQLRLFRAPARFRLKYGVEEIQLFLARHPKTDVLRRFERLAQWMSSVNQQTHDGVMLTPLLNKYLAGPGDFESLIVELNRLRLETRAGRFDKANPVQRDLEFCRFATEYAWQNDVPVGDDGQYAKFEALGELPPPVEEEFLLSGQHLLQVKRVAYEAAGFLQFLRELRAKSNRPIVVIGNDRYGKQWVVEPLEDYLKNGFTLRYPRNPSHKSYRLRVRDEMLGKARLGITRDLVRELSDAMPHVVIADSCDPVGLGRADDVMRISRGARDYVNWFMVFNDIRAEGDVTKYESDSSLPPNHIAELKRWHEFDRARREIRPWVRPGPTYRIAHWAPVLKARVRLGDFDVQRRDPDFSDGSAQVVLANPAFYVDDGAEPPDALRGTTPYYFDGPEQFVKESLTFGFGPFGLETRLEGPTTDQFVEAVQEQIKREIPGFLKEDGVS